MAKKQGSNGPKKDSTGGKKASVGLAQRTNPKLRKGSFMMETQKSSKFEGTIRVRGHELIDVNGSSATALGAVLMNIFVNPLAFGGTRLAGLAKLYEKYIFRKLDVYYEGNNAATSVGGLVLAYDRDISDLTPSQDVQGLRELTANASSCLFKIWEEGHIDCKLTDTQDFYYTNDDGQAERFAYQGQIYLAVTSALSVASSGVMWIEYDIELMDPSFESQGDSIDVVKTGTATQSTTVDAGFDTLDTVVSTTGKFSFKTDSAGHKYIEVPSGHTYLISLFSVTNQNAGMGVDSLDVHVPNSARVGSATVTQLENVKTVSVLTEPYAALYQIVIPALGGLAAIYCTLAAAGTSGGYGVRVLSAVGE